MTSATIPEHRGTSFRTEGPSSREGNKQPHPHSTRFRIRSILRPKKLSGIWGHPAFCGPLPNPPLDRTPRPSYRHNVRQQCIEVVGCLRRYCMASRFSDRTVGCLVKTTSQRRGPRRCTSGGRHFSKVVPRDSVAAKWWQPFDNIGQMAINILGEESCIPTHMDIIERGVGSWVDVDRGLEHFGIMGEPIFLLYILFLSC